MVVRESSLSSLHNSKVRRKKTNIPEDFARFFKFEKCSAARCYTGQHVKKNKGPLCNGLRNPVRVRRPKEKEGEKRCIQMAYITQSGIGFSSIWPIRP